MRRLVLGLLMLSALFVPFVAIPTRVSAAQEVLTVPFVNGPAGVETTKKYKGYIEIEVSGFGQAASTQLSDAFYIFTDELGNPREPEHIDDFGLYINDLPVDSYVGLLSYRESHVYRFTIYTTEQKLSFKFAIGDAFTPDNTGAFTISLKTTKNPDLVPPGTSFEVAAPFTNCKVKDRHTNSPKPGHKRILKVGFSVANGTCDQNSGTMSLTSVAFGSAAGGFQANTPPDQESHVESLMIIDFVPEFTGLARIDASLTVDGKAGASAGSGFIVSVSVLDEVGMALVEYLTDALLGTFLDLVSLIENLLFPTVAISTTDAFLRVGQDELANADIHPDTAASFPLPGPFTSEAEYHAQPVQMSTLIEVKKGKRVRIELGVRADTQAWGWAESLVRLGHVTVDSVTVTKQ